MNTPGRGKTHKSVQGHKYIKYIQGGVDRLDSGKHLVHFTKKDYWNNTDQLDCCLNLMKNKYIPFKFIF